MSASLVGSEMCIRDRGGPGEAGDPPVRPRAVPCERRRPLVRRRSPESRSCLLYTSDAADDM
eukprot:6673057-Alexandrium_andersonii.AAC.1